MSDLDGILDRLSDAASASELAQAHRAATRAVLAERRRSTVRGTGELAKTIFAALDLRDQMKAKGASQEELDAYLERVIRVSWPHGRVWKYLCTTCDDTGRIVRVCWKGARCTGRSTVQGHMRICAKDPSADYEHEYAEPCHCSLGARFRPKQRTVTDELTQLGKTSKPTRWGRS